MMSFVLLSLSYNFDFLAQLAQPIRLILAYTETEYEDKRYTCGPAPGNVILVLNTLCLCFKHAHFYE